MYQNASLCCIIVSFYINLDFSSFFTQVFFFCLHLWIVNACRFLIYNRIGLWTFLLMIKYIYIYSINLIQIIQYKKLHDFYSPTMVLTNSPLVFNLNWEILERGFASLLLNTEREYFSVDSLDRSREHSTRTSYLLCLREYWKMQVKIPCVILWIIKGIIDSHKLSYLLCFGRAREWSHQLVEMQIKIFWIISSVYTAYSTFISIPRVWVMFQ